MLIMIILITYYLAQFTCEGTAGENPDYLGIKGAFYVDSSVQDVQDFLIQ